MLVNDPPDRNAFMPRSVPATIFGPGDRVSGGYYAYQRGCVREVQNVRWSKLAPEELAYVKGHIAEWTPPDAPCKAPATDTWNAAEVHGDAQPDLASVPEIPGEAPLVEEAVAPARDLVIDRVHSDHSEDEAPEDPGDAIAFAARGVSRRCQLKHNRNTGQVTAHSP